jgi:hypothetical protein
MNPGMKRRVFIGSVAAGMPLLAGGALVAESAVPGAQHLHASDAGDPVFEQLLREMATVHNRARSGPRGEDARALAAQLRLVAVLGKTKELDDQIRRGISDLVARHGRDQVVHLPPDRPHMQQQLQQYGAEVDERAFTAPFAPDDATLSAGLAILEREGLTPTLERVAARLERLAPEFDERASPVVRVQDANYWQGYCSSIWGSYTEAQSFAGPICVVAKYVWFVEYGCAAAQLAALVLFFDWLWYCGYNA